MNKILTEVFLPANGKSYEIFLSEDIFVYEAAGLISEILTEVSDGFFTASASDILCSREDGKMYDPNKKLYEVGIKNYSRLMLI